MKHSWPRLPLGEVILSIIDHRGRTPKKLGGDFSESGVIVLSANNIRNGRIEIDADVGHVSHQMYERWMPQRLEADDVLLTSEGPLGQLAFLKTGADYCLGQRVFGLRPDPKKVVGRFLFYALQSSMVQHQLKARQTGTTVEGIRQSELTKVEIELPPLPEQRAIASVLGMVDDGIDLNQKMNQTLEEIARALFKFWFVDFGPVRAKANGRWKKGESLPGMPASTWDIWPTEFKDSELGEIPDRWRTASIGDEEFAHVQPGIGFDCGKKLLYIATGDVQHGTIIGEAEDTRANLPSRANMQPGGGRVWFAKMRDSPKHLWTMREHESWWQQRVLSTGFAGIQARDPIFESVLYCFVSSSVFEGTKNSLATGTTMQALNNTSLQTISMVVPEMGIAREFDRVVRPIYLQVWNNAMQSRTLASIRDALLPGLFSGTIRVPAIGGH